MRNDEDDIRQYMPVLRQIIILVAVLTAVPVVLWTITAFVRTYVGPPKLPIFQPMTTSTLRKAPDSAAPASYMRSPAAPAAQETNAAPLPALVEASATTTDARGPVLETKQPAVGEQPPGIDVNAPSGDAKTAGATVALSPSAAPAAAAPSAADTADNVAAPSPVAHPAPAPAPSPAPNSAMQVAGQQPPAANWPAPAVDPLPPAEPIAGPVPLPRQRPQLFAMAQTGIPLPRPRPASAGPVTPETPAGPLYWFQSIFQQHQ